MNNVHVFTIGVFFKHVLRKTSKRNSTDRANLVGARNQLPQLTLLCLLIDEFRFQISVAPTDSLGFIPKSRFAGSLIQAALSAGTTGKNYTR